MPNVPALRPAPRLTPHKPGCYVGEHVILRDVLSVFGVTHNFSHAVITYDALCNRLRQIKE